MIAVLTAVIVTAGLAIGPQLWIKTVLSRHGRERPDFPGTGGEFARHLLDEMRLVHVKVEETPAGDHYDPQAKAVRLSPEYFHGRSVTAVAVAAHETGHAMQDAIGYPPLAARTRLARSARIAERIGGLVILASPLMGIVLRHPVGILIELLAGFAILSLGVVAHLATLPVEFDASFNRALPLLKAGRYLPERDLPAVRAILRAAAFSYVAAALLSFLNAGRWLRFRF